MNSGMFLLPRCQQPSAEGRAHTEDLREAVNSILYARLK